MAQRAITIWTDDLTGAELSKDTGRTVTFSIGNDRREIDLTHENAARFEEVLQPYVAAGRRVAGKPKPVTVASQMDPDLVKEIREWAKRQPGGARSRGRLSQATVDAYYAAHNGGRAKSAV